LEKLAKRQAQFDVIYADPPYEAIYGKKVVEAVDRLPLLASGGHLFIEDSKRNLKEEDSYSTLTLVDARNMGRTTLFHYQKGK
jgi:16S rRNA G966 N2-methylase RsmD